MNILLSLYLASASNTFNLPPKLLEAVCYTESSFDINAVHVDDGNQDSLGVCQIQPRTAVWLGYQGTPEGLMNPQVNAYYAAKYLSKNLRKYSGNVEKAVIAYNRGNAYGLTHTAYSQRVLNEWRKRGKCTQASCRH